MGTRRYPTEIAGVQPGVRVEGDARPLPPAGRPLSIGEAMIWAILGTEVLSVTWALYRGEDLAWALVRGLAPLLLAVLLLVAYIVVWFALHTIPHLQATAELVARRDLNASGRVGDVLPPLPAAEDDGLTAWVAAELAGRKMAQLEAGKQSQLEDATRALDDRDLLEFTRACLMTNTSHSKSAWTGHQGAARLPSHRKFAHSDWRRVLIDPQVSAGNMTLQTASDGRDWAQWVVRDWVAAAERLVAAGYLATVRDRLDELAAGE